MKKTNVFIVLALIAFAILSGCKETKKDSSEKWTVLYDGNGMEMWNKYLSAPWSYYKENGFDIHYSIDKSEHLGWDNDPYEVFTEIEKDGEKMIRISGEVYGALISKEEYENYHLRLIFKWGTLKWEPRLEENLDCGLLYHSVGPPGIGHNAWMRSNEFQIEDGHCGDFYTVAGITNTITAIPDTASIFYIYSPTGEPITFGGSNYWCRVNTNYENAPGEWNTLDLYTYGGESIHAVNGQMVMKLLDSRQTNEKGKEEPVTSGKIQIQSEAAEVFISYVGITKISSLPEL